MKIGTGITKTNTNVSAAKKHRLKWCSRFYKVVQLNKNEKRPN